MTSHFKVIIVGGGTAGITVAARLLRQSKAFEQDIAIFDPAEKHYYQPLWTLVGAGVAKKETTCHEMKGLIPEGAHWIRQAVLRFEPEENQITTASGETYTYDYLVVGAGIQVNWDGIAGLKETLGKNNVCSNYSYEHVDYTWETIRNFTGGNAIFTHPDTPVKCGGAPQKIMYLAEDSFNRSGVRDQSTIIFGSANPAIFDVPKYRKALEEVVHRKQIDPHYRHNLIEVRGEQKEAIFENLDTGEIKTLKFDMLHVTPPMQAPTFIKESPLADENGWVDVHKYTLQHNRYPNVFGLGDSSNLPTSKTGAAIRKQAPVVVENLMAIIKDQPINARYDGYTSCPLVTGYNSLILAEFDYEKNPSESMPFNQAKERKSMYFLKKDMLPVIYWDGMLKGVL
ncbi:FAD-dependent oxidoreductase [Rossellomorea sp. BNER]|uniref:NAD(P)/FAD-dependent oxidoreductase n=1 Tax=Rossellomorea sp. BNER TaxID=2962031 RepID=UPI003AF2FB48|nr:NAD(P)/FAD-dependent oxidoreductase [Rossellomorea sp. BNER]